MSDQFEEDRVGATSISDVAEKKRLLSINNVSAKTKIYVSSNRSNHFKSDRECVEGRSTKR